MLDVSVSSLVHNTSPLDVNGSSVYENMAWVGRLHLFMLVFKEFSRTSVSHILWIQLAYHTSRSSSIGEMELHCYPMDLQYNVEKPRPYGNNPDLSLKIPQGEKARQAPHAHSHGGSHCVYQFHQIPMSERVVLAEQGVGPIRLCEALLDSTRWGSEATFDQIAHVKRG